MYSIYQKHEFIKKYCEKLAEEYGIEFLYRDFRVGFWKGHEEAKEAKLYMQKYCGCIFSEYESAKAKEMRRELKKQGINATDDYMRGILYKKD